MINSSALNLHQSDIDIQLHLPVVNGLIPHRRLSFTHIDEQCSSGDVSAGCLGLEGAAEWREKAEYSCER